jgi:DNA-binding NarL/FixJ family response regulator
MDVSMPQMNGIDAATQMRAAAPQSKVIFVSATDDPQVIQAAMEAGGVAYVMKPRAGRELILAIRRALQSV